MDQEEPQEDSHSESEDEPVNEPHGSDIIQEREEISENDWDQMLKKGKFKKEDMDMLVMDFLLNKELPIVAEAFHRESGCKLDLEDLPHIGTQRIVRELIFNLQFDDVIRVINETQTTVYFDFWPRLRFYLEQQKMIELCRKGDFNAALDFSRKFIKWRDFKDKWDNFDFKKECCSTLLLMMFGNDKESPVADLLDFKRIFWISKVVVDKMMDYNGRQTGNLIERAMKMLRWDQYELNNVVEFPYFNIDSGYPEPLPHPYTGVRDTL